MTASPAFTEYTVLTTSPHIKPHTRRHYLPRHNSGATVARQHTAHFPAQPVGGGGGAAGRWRSSHSGAINSVYAGLSRCGCEEHCPGHCLGLPRCWATASMPQHP